MKSKKLHKTHFSKPIINTLSYVHNYIHALNSSKMFAGLMIIVLNIASRFVTIKLSKSMESYLKYTFSRQVLIFAIAWMGTRDIYIALIISTVFMICMDFLFNEDSRFCCLPSDFTDYHTQLFDANQTNNPQTGLPGQANTNQSTTNQANTNPIISSTIDNKNISNNNLTISEEEIQKAKDTLAKAKQQNSQLQYQSFYKYNDYYSSQM